MKNQFINYDLLPPPRNELNDFTLEVKRRVLEQGRCIVQTRYGVVVIVEEFKDITEGDNEEPHFYGQGYCWDANGKSVQTLGYDLIEIIT